MKPNTTAGQRIGQQTTDNFAFSNGAATSTAAAATVNLPQANITTESLTTAAGATYTFTLTNSLITPSSFVGVMVGNGTNTGGTPTVTTVTPGTGSAVIVVHNAHATVAFNGTLKLNVLVAQ